MKSGWQFLWLAVGVFVVIGVAGILSVPIWKENQFASLRKENRSLLKAKEELLNQLAALNWKANTLRSRTRLETLAKDHFSLGYHSMPTLVEDTYER